MDYGLWTAWSCPDRDWVNKDRSLGVVKEISDLFVGSCLHEFTHNMSLLARTNVGGKLFSTRFVLDGRDGQVK